MININIGIADNFQSEKVFTKNTINQSSAPIRSSKLPSATGKIR